MSKETKTAVFFSENTAKIFIRRSIDKVTKKMTGQENKTTEKGMSKSTAMIITICVIFILGAIYVIFNNSYELVDFPEGAKTEKTLGNKEDILDEITKVHPTTACYEGVYLKNVYLVTAIYVDFYRGYEILEDLEILENTDFRDDYLNKSIRSLKKGIEGSDKKVTEHEIQKKFKTMKLNVLKKHTQEKFKTSPLIKSLANVISFYRKGEYALEAGGVEEAMEKATFALEQHSVKDAYDIVLSLKEPYKEITHDWLKETGYFLTIKDVLEDIRRYIYSDKYSGKFIKMCR